MGSLVALRGRGEGGARGSTDADSGGKTMTAESITLEQAIETLVYDALAQTHGGWENNEGGFGAFVFDVAARTLRLTMNARVTETLVSRHGF